MFDVKKQYEEKYARGKKKDPFETNFDFVV